MADSLSCLCFVRRGILLMPVHKGILQNKSCKAFVFRNCWHHSEVSDVQRQTMPVISAADRLCTRGDYANESFFMTFQSKPDAAPLPTT